MPAKMARSAPRSPFGLPEATAVVRAASLSCQNEGKAPKFSRNRESSGESRLLAAPGTILGSAASEARWHRSQPARLRRDRRQ